MANTRELRRRIKAIRNISQITKAMQMVAASKMRRAQQAALAGRPYSALLNKVLVSLQKRTDAKLHPLLRVRTVKKELVIVISTDKGLAGALNTNLFREVSKSPVEATDYISTGRKARQFITRTKRNLLADFELKDAPSLIETKAITNFAIEKFLAREVDKVSIVFTHFLNTINQVATTQTLLPISPLDLPHGKKDEATGGEDVDPMLEYNFEPSPEAVLDLILPFYLHFQVYQMILDARASEHSARMVAMKNATDNAREFIRDLSLEYNKMRQASITTELLEIATAQMALGG